MKIVGTADRSEIEMNPQEAWRRARIMDAMFFASRATYPKGVTRASHAEFQRRDTARMLEIARRINPS
jgi:hypothetical protein